VQAKRLLSAGFITGLLFWTLLALIILNRVMVFMQLNMVYIDSDQPFMWVAASDYARGLFPEPRYYGQNYNTHMEALFAVPFIWMHLPVYIAVPLATHIIWIFPFLFIAFYLYVKKRRLHAVLVLALVVCFAAEYDLLTAIPRGFVTGTFFCGFFITSILQPHNIRYVWLNTTFAVVAYFINPNSVLVSAPVLFFLFLHNFRSSKYYLWSLVGVLSVIPMYLIFDLFYKQHPEYVVHGIDLKFSVANFRNNLPELVSDFIHISPFSDRFTWFWPCLFAVFSIFFFTYNRKVFYSMLAFLTVVFAALFSDKVADGTDWTFFSISRMYLGVPLVFVLFSALLPLRAKPALIAIAAVSLPFACYKGVTLKTHVNNHTDPNNTFWFGVHLVELVKVIDAIDFFKRVCHDHKVDDFLISNFYWLSTYVNYGGPAMYKDYPHTTEINNEKRLYVKQGLAAKRPERFLMITEYSVVDTLLTDLDLKLKRLDDYGLFLVTENTYSFDKLCLLLREREWKLHQLKEKEAYGTP
jgi:hypothetical protein